jgi:Transposase DDE domain
VPIDARAVQAALEKLKSDPEPEARFMRTVKGSVPAYNVQTAVDTEHAMIVVQQVTNEATDNRSLLSMAEAAKAALGNPETLNLVADAGYSNGEQAEQCEAQGVVLHVPANRAVNNQGDGALFDRSQFHYDESTDTYRCPGDQRRARKQLQRNKTRVIHAGDPAVCNACALKSRCTNAPQRVVNRHLHEGVLQRMQQRATAEMMRLCRATVEHPFASLKYRIFGNPRFLLRGLRGAQAEISLATMVYNLKRILNVLGASRLRQALAEN